MASEVMQKIVGATVSEGTLSVTWFEQNHFVLKNHHGTMIHIDPFVSRVIKPEGHFNPEPLAQPHECIANYVFLTHDHRDHTDPHTLLPMLESNPEMCIYCPPESQAHLVGLVPAAEERIMAVVAGDTVKFGSNTAETVYAMPTGGADDVMHIGFVYDFDGIIVYMVGDTRDEPEEYMEKLTAVEGLNPDLMIVPINDGYRNPGPRGASKLVDYVDPKLIVPCHFGCFTYNTIDPKLFIKALPERYRERVSILALGETIEILTCPSGP